MFLGLMSESVLCRVSAKSRPGAGHCSGSPMRSNCSLSEFASAGPDMPIINATSAPAKKNKNTAPKTLTF